MQLGFIGLGKMGGNMALRLTAGSPDGSVKGGHSVVGYAKDPNPDLAAHKDIELVTTLEEVVGKLALQRVVWVMVPSGHATETVISDLSRLLSKGDIIIDGGNSYYKDSVRRAQGLAAHGIGFIDVGTSGGVWGRSEGYCMMVGGGDEDVARCKPILDTLAPADGWAQMGRHGAGHFVKMVHNGIEYGMMQAYGEGFEVLFKSDFKPDLHKVAQVWNRGSVVRSWLLELAERALEGESDLHSIMPYVEDSGEGRWTIQQAIEEDVPVPVIAASLFARFASRDPYNFAARFNAALRNQFGGHNIRKAPVERLTSEGHTKQEGTDMPNQVACAIVIFGASGDLAQLKLIPAIYELCREKLVADKFVLVGYARSKEKKDGTPLTDEQYRKDCYEAIKKNARHKPIDESVWKRMEPNIFYVAGAYDSADDHARLSVKLKELDKTHDTGGNRMFYISTPPEVFEGIIDRLGERQQESTPDKPTGWQRIIIEKPFGRDLESAKHLNGVLHEYFEEKQVFRIDHYLGKETVQNLMVMRFANSIFEPIWNYKYIDHVQITVSETVSADDRAGYYDKSGATRDMIQNHMFQLMALVAMEPPAALDATSIRDEKVKVYKSVRPVDKAAIGSFAIRGQYGPGEFKGKTGKIATPGYLKAKGVAPGSTTETFSAMKLYIDNWRWSGTPFYLRTGKCLPTKLSEVVVRFRSPPLTLFQKQCESPVFPNDLVIRVQPEEGVSWRLNGKVPGGAMNIKSVALDFLYKTAFNAEPPEAYERLLYDALIGDQTLFIRGDEAEAAWMVIDPIEQAWAASKRMPEQYCADSWGPKTAMDLIELDGRRWLHSGDEVEPVVACSI